jgi:hypothetical protein
MSTILRADLVTDEVGWLSFIGCKKEPAFRREWDSHVVGYLKYVSKRPHQKVRVTIELIEEDE